ncbi:MAG: trypsin-like peptidase domain-containing protein [Desulfobacterales bacterium]|nr:trypsin-like peptidase domain-containing protein [Desulfobacterales bacterium]
MTLVRMPNSESNIHTAISPVFAWNDNKSPRVVGTAILLGPCLALTALHVVEDFVCRNRQEAEVNVNVAVYHAFTGAAWYVRRTWATTHTDAAFLGLRPQNDAAKNFKWHRVGINLHLPKPGEKIFAAGFRHSKIDDVDEGFNQEGITVVKASLSLQTVNGTVRESYGSKHEGHLDFPCFQCNAKFDSQMSGGPVLDESGYLRGLVCTSFEFDSTDMSEPVSFVAGILPVMAIKIDRTLPELNEVSPYHVLDLARNGFLPVMGHERVMITDLKEGRTRIEFK